MLRNLSIRTGLLTLLAVMTFLLLFVSGMGIFALQQSSTSLQNINRLQGEQMVRLSDGYVSLLRARNGAGQAVRQMEIGLLEDATKSTDYVASDVAAAQQQLKEFIDSGVSDEEGNRLIQNLAQSYAEYLAKGINPMLAALTKQSPDDYYDLLEKTLIPLSQKFDTDVEIFKQWGEARGNSEVEAVQLHKKIVLTLIIIAALLTAVIIVLVWLALRHLLLKPLNQSIEQLEFVARGDLTQTLPPAGNNEFGRLATAITIMRDSLMESVSRVRDASSQIDTGSRELAAGNQNLAQRTESTATSLEQTAASMEQITATVKQNADNAEQAHKLAKDVSDTADRGSEMVCYVIEKMRDISSSSDRIADILSVIDGIAFQTNILALNASVEAARAGEQGRGFAVVAGEVRILASRSADAAKEIRTLISDSQNHVGEGRELAQQAGETMDEIAEEVMRMTRLVSEIANASNEQSYGIEQVNIAVSQMDEAAQQNAALVQESTAATRSLEEQSQHLVAAMATFRCTRHT
ncbi:methyl-accepting chemotaxis protein [Buttiauxella gaviniae]|uniref:methyl-accepting chemotaxis protein n=1 Tax=Buttiauxella gaviniae TaxID=82990 RepID=UPI003C745474